MLITLYPKEYLIITPVLKFFIYENQESVIIRFG